MKRLLARALAFCVVALPCMSAFGAVPGTLAGIVRDGDGKPLSGARVALSPSTSAASSQMAVTGPSGEYRFEGLDGGEYALRAELSGYTAAEGVLVHVAPGTSVRADLTLRAMAQSPARPALKFEAAGIRGLIDPGGYSASAAGAASGILRGIAEVKRTDKGFGATSAKDWPCALEPELHKAVAEHPERAEVYRRLGQFYDAHDQTAQAIPVLKKALEIDGGDVAAARELALAWLRIGEFERARTALAALVARHDEAELHQLLARANEGSGMFQEAAREYRTAGREEASEESSFGEGYELILAGSPAEGVAVLEAGVKRFPRSIPLRVGAGTAEFLAGHAADAVRSFLDATDVDPVDPRPYPFLASASGSWGEQAERAANVLKRFVERAPASGAAHAYYALALSQQKTGAETDVIELHLKQAVRLDGNLAGAHEQLANLYSERNDFADAAPEYEAALRLDKSLTEAHYRLANAYRRMGRVDESARELQIFKQLKEQQTAGSGGINIAQFISVFDAPEQHQGGDAQCAAQVH